MKLRTLLGTVMIRRLFVAPCWVALVLLAPIGWGAESEKPTGTQEHEVLREETSVPC
jgi:hypothetical protein